MRLQRVGLAMAALCSAALFACGDSGRPSGGQDATGGEAGSADASGVGGTNGTTTGGVLGLDAGGSGSNPGAGSGGTSVQDSASGGASNDSAGAPSAGGLGGVSYAGSAADTTYSECGNGIREQGEQCDGDDIGGLSCAALAFDSGSLSCNASCRLDLSACAGTEHCFDGMDNDGDAEIDCADSDCEGTCSDACTVTGVLDENGATDGTLAGRSAELSPYCSLEPTLGEAVYAVTPTDDGVLEVNLNAMEAATVSARTECANDDRQLTCTGLDSLEVPVTADETIYLVVEGEASDGFGFFGLSLRLRTLGCGNAAREADEECDDGNTADGDGCSSACALEASESESNRSVWRANWYVDPFYAQISDASDHDYVAVVVAEPPMGFFVNTYDFGDGACDAGELDSTLTLLAPDGQTILAEDDDGGAGYCASIEFVPGGADAGTYYVVVSSSEFGTVHQFPYILDVLVDLCGNGILSPREGCDDGNRDDFDGCSALCLIES